MTGAAGDDLRPEGAADVGHAADAPRTSDDRPTTPAPASHGTAAAAPRTTFREVVRTVDGEVWLRVRLVAGGVRAFIGAEDAEVDVTIPPDVAGRLAAALDAAAAGATSDAVADPPVDLRGDPWPASPWTGGDRTAPVALPPVARTASAPPTPPAPQPTPHPWEDIPDERAADEAYEAVLVRFRQLGDALPETVEIDSLGSPALRVSTRMFATVERQDDMPVVRFKATADVQAELLADPRFRADPETGQHGWTNLRADGVREDDELERLLVSSYRLVAPADAIQQLDEIIAAAEEARRARHANPDR